MTPRPLHIILAEGDPRLAEFLTDILEARGHRVVPVPDGEAALSAPEPEVLILDVGLDVIGGLDSLERFRRRGNSSRCVVLSAVPAWMPAVARCAWVPRTS